MSDASGEEKAKRLLGREPRKDVNPDEAGPPVRRSKVSVVWRPQKTFYCGRYPPCHSAFETLGG